jgi:thiamine kinase-like enzyme
MTSAGDEAQTWKDVLMEGKFSSSIAERAGSLLRTVQQNSYRIAQESQVKLADQKYFIQLRVDPFHRWLIKRYPELSFSIQKLIDELTMQKICLVHGDYSPKNMLVDKDENIVLIDFEVAHWGNPVFDVAYCIGHLMLKGWHMERQRASLKLIEVFLVKYATEVKNIIPHLGLMLLARIDGKSPVNYIREENLKNIIRKVGMDWIQEKIDYSNPLENIEFAFQTR